MLLSVPIISPAVFAVGREGLNVEFSVARTLTEDGFHPNGHKCTEKNIKRILNNHFYIGAFKYRGKYYSDGQHEALISKDV